MSGLGGCFADTFCMPIWLENDIASTQKTTHGKKQAVQPCPPENSLISLATSEGDFFESRDGASLSNARRSGSDSIVREDRMISPTNSLTGTSQDLDEVIQRIVSRRDELQRERNIANDEIKRLELENENLKNLNAISKRLNQSHKEQVTKLKIQLAENSMKHHEDINKMEREKLADLAKIEQLEAIVAKMRAQTLHAQNALDEGSFFWGFSSGTPEDPVVINAEEQYLQEESGKEELKKSLVVEVSQPAAEESAPDQQTSEDALEKMFGWTVGV